MKRCIAFGLTVLTLFCLAAPLSAEEFLGTDQIVAQASAAKVYGTEYFVEAWRLLMEIVGESGTLCSGSSAAILNGLLERRYRSGSVLTFGGGTNESQRDIVAAAGLHMPRNR